MDILDDSANVLATQPPDEVMFGAYRPKFCILVASALGAMGNGAVSIAIVR